MKNPRKNKPKQRKQIPNGSEQVRKNPEESDHCQHHATGPIQIDLAESLWRAYTSNQTESAAHNTKLLRWTKISTVLILIYAFLTFLMYRANRRAADAASTAASAAQGALVQAKNEFRENQRPYVWLAPAGDRGKLSIAQTGKYAGHLVFELHISNYGKSPAIEIGRDARLAIGQAEAESIRLHTTTDQRGRILAPEDKPSLYAYSDDIVTPEMFNDIFAGKVLVIAYGHIEYTDTFSEPRPKYISEFCTGVIMPINRMQNFGEAEVSDKYCKDHNRIN